MRPNDIDASRMQILIVNSKGKRTREIPLPKSTHKILKKYWETHKNPNFIFPSSQKSKALASVSTRPMNPDVAQRCFKSVIKSLGITRKITIHTLRHCYATHLLDAGVNIRKVQMYLGHSDIKTTCMYLHLTSKGQASAVTIINNLFGGGSDE